jgi:hypothetical protein
MLAKALIILLFLGILGSLGSAMLFMLKDGGRGDRTAKALTLRIGVSVLLFVLLFVLWAAGMVQPHPLGH